ncbi:hypothetical protein HNP55_003582 [Paucibacter oligotrophus]|uniref:Uncharacterized protein n=1 Tax=Roseateles oligotrophus TaxID=1769250 RepID=A0A840LA83_9BURK|nr:hypothetical protein [Roseateles oligotrophus]MBB4845036.1 hypothetical protein [Roseateles oligotrophus]
MADNDLKFRRLLDTSHPVNLVFGQPDDGLSPGDASGSIAIMFSPPVIALQGDTAPGPSWRKVVAQTSNPWQPGQQRSQGASLPTAESTPYRTSAGLPWAPGRPNPAGLRADWDRPGRASPQAAGAWGIGQGRGAASGPGWQASARAGAAKSTAWALAEQRSALTLSRWQELARIAEDQLGTWGQGDRRSLATRALWGEGSGLGLDERSPWQLGKLPDPGASVIVPWVPPGPEPHVCYRPPPGGAVVVEFKTPASTDTLIEFKCGGKATQIVVPVRRTYIVQNNVSLTLVDGTPVPVDGMALSLDADSWTWGFSASLPGSSLALVTPAAGGDPVELLAHINGEIYRVMADSLSRARAHGKSGLTLRGRGRSAELDAPYSPPINLGTPADRTARQLAEDALATTGWTVDWGIDNWLVPAGAWSFQGSRMGALNSIAAAVGAYVQPHAQDRTLYIKPRYPVAAWKWGDLAGGVALPSAVVTQEGLDWISKPAFNRIFVQGARAGVRGRVTIGGTAGDQLAPMVTDPLIVHATAARMRGIAELSAGGRSVLASLKLPVLAQTGILRPGKVVQYSDGPDVRTGIVRSVAVDAGFPEVWQTLGVETRV